MSDSQVYVETVSRYPLDKLADLEIIDLHVHVGPEIVPRRYMPADLAKDLRAYRMGAVVKNHFIPTTYLLSGTDAWDVLTGSVVLNTFTGGLHPDAIRNAISGMKQNAQQRHPDERRIVVWMPTISAKAHLDYYGRDLDPAWGVPAQYSISRDSARALSVLSGHGSNKRETAFPGLHAVREVREKNDQPQRANPDAPLGELTRPVEAVLHEIARNDFVLATGHLSRNEIMVLVPRAIELGVRRVIVTHAFFPPNGLTIEDQLALTQYPGVYIEHCWFVSIVDPVSVADYVESIRAIGPEKTVISTDGGQMVSAPIPEAWSIFIGELMAAGITLDEIKTMASVNPRRLLFGP